VSTGSQSRYFYIFGCHVGWFWFGLGLTKNRQNLNLWIFSRFQNTIKFTRVGIHSSNFLIWKRKWVLWLFVSNMFKQHWFESNSYFPRTSYRKSIEKPDIFGYLPLFLLVIPKALRTDRGLAGFDPSTPEDGCTGGELLKAH
jgi:hypothetical protein